MRERILAAAFDAFVDRGYAATSTLEIATRAPVSKRELYALVGNKQRMLITAIGERANTRASVARSRSVGMLAADLAEQFAGPLWRDLMISLLLRVTERPSPGAIEARARDAAVAFLQLHPLPTTFAARPVRRKEDASDAEP